MFLAENPYSVHTLQYDNARSVMAVAALRPFLESHVVHATYLNADDHFPVAALATAAETEALSLPLAYSRHHLISQEVVDGFGATYLEARRADVPLLDAARAGVAAVNRSIADSKK